MTGAFIVLFSILICCIDADKKGLNTRSRGSRRLHNHKCDCKKYKKYKKNWRRMNEYPPSSPSCRSLTRTAHHPEDRLVTTLFYLPTYLSTYLSNSLSLCIQHEFWQLWVPESYNFFLLWIRRRRRRWRRLISIFENYCCHFFIRQSRRVFDECIQQWDRHSMTICKNAFVCV